MRMLIYKILVVIIAVAFCMAGCTQTFQLETNLPEATEPAPVPVSSTKSETEGETIVKDEDKPSVSPFGEDYDIVITMEGEATGEYDLDFQVGPIMFGTPFTEIVTLLGLPEKEEKTQYQEYDGKWHQSVSYTSKGISLKIRSVEEKEEYLVEYVTIYEPFCGKTAEGIGIGSSEKEVRAAYNDMINPDDSSEHAIVLGSVYWGVHFHLSDEGIVESITFGADAE